jgi:hypothetical protein
MSDELREKQDYIEKYVDDYEFRGDGGDYSPSEREHLLIYDAIQGLIEDEKFLALISTPFLSQPSGVVAVRKCAEFHMENELGIIGKHPATCECHGTGEIVRELTEKELLELPKMIMEGRVHVIADINTLGYIIQLPSSERLRIKESK